MSGQHLAADEHTGGAAAVCRLPSPASIVVLVALGALLLAKWRDGALALYVHPGYVPALALTGAVLVGLGVVRLAILARQLLGRPGDAADVPGFSWTLGTVALAIVLAALVPPRPLGSAAAASQATVAAPLPLLPLTDETEGWTLLEWAQAVDGGVQRERLVGRRVSVVGFVYRPRGGAADDVVVARFVIRCCAADGFAVSLPIRHPEAATLQPDTWIQVEGVLRLDESGPRTIPYVEADRLTVVPPPATPYLIPA
jgi:uncharacterized repeat protein (TIGR03943 family)